MGANISNQFSDATVSSLTTVVNDTMNSVIQNIATTCTTDNRFSGQFGIFPVNVNTRTGDIQTAPCQTSINRVVITQNATDTCSIQGGLTNNLNSQITNNLSTNINSWLTQNASQNNGFLGIGINIAASESITQIQLANDIANSISNNLNQACNSFLEASNTANIYVCGDYPQGVYETQNAVATNLTTCVVNNMVTNIMNNQVLNNIVIRTIQKTNQTNEGIFSPLRWLIIGAVIIGVVIIVAVLLFLIFGSKGGGGKGEQKQILKQELEQRLLERREGGIASSSRLGALERGAEARTGFSGGYLSPEAEEGIRNVAERFGRFGRRF